VAAAALRCIACAGVLAAGLFGGGIASADTGDSSSGSEGTGSETTTDDKPTTTVGSGAETTDEPATMFKSSLSIPVLRWPEPKEAHETGVSAFVATVDIPVPEIDDVFSALRQPDPEPTPSFRTQEEAPVVDAGGDGSDMLSATTGEPPVLQAPLVAAPLPAGTPPPSPVVPAGASAGGPAAQPVAATGATAPLTRGAPQHTTEPASSNYFLTPLNGQATRVGYPRFLRTPTLRDLATVALPGVAGLLFVTFGGGFLGYRQANSLRFVRTQGAERFLR
jgi:hypothetical protein